MKVRIAVRRKARLLTCAPWAAAGDALSEPMMNEMLRMVSVDPDYEQLRYGDLVDTIVGRPPRSRLVMAKSRGGATGEVAGAAATSP